MPEMKGRSLEELDEIFEAKVGPWKFKEYQCTIRDEAAFDMQERGVRIEKDGIVGEEVEIVDESKV